MPEQVKTYDFIVEVTKVGNVMELDESKKPLRREHTIKPTDC